MCQSLSGIDDRRDQLLLASEQPTLLFHSGVVEDMVLLLEYERVAAR